MPLRTARRTLVSAFAPAPRRAFAPALALVLAAFAASCGGEPEPALRVAGLGFSDDELLGLSADRRAVLADLAAFGRAVADSTLDAVHAPLLAERVRARLWRLAEARRVLDEAGAGDEVLEARYRTDPDYELTVRHLLIFSARYESDATREAARQKAERALERIRAGEDLATVAAEVSEEPGAESRAGLLTPGREGAWVPEFWNAALALDPGEISGVVETQYGFHVLRLEDRQVVPFAEVRDEVALEVAQMITPIDGEPPAGWTAPDGLAVGDGWRVAEARALEDRAMAWAGLLGFRRGMSDDELREAALTALSATRQNATVARDELQRALGPALRRAYPAETVPSGDS